MRSTEEKLGWLVDRALISDLLFSFASALDTKNWQEYRDNYADGGVIELPDPMSVTFATFSLGKEQMIDLLPKSLGRYRATHHISTNHRIVIAGDEATSRSYLQAVHVTGAPTEHWSAGGWYDCRYVRTSAGWKFIHVKLHPVWLMGQVADVKPG